MESGVGDGEGRGDVMGLMGAIAWVWVVLGGAGPSAPRLAPMDGPGPARPDIRVTYPSPGQRIAAYDSNFVFGSVGEGEAILTINGHPVDVAPNGAFLAWLPVPPRTDGNRGIYRLIARRDSLSDELELPVELPSVRPTDHEGPWVLSSIERMADRWLLPGEALDLEVRAEAGLELAFVAGTARFPAIQTGEPVVAGAPVSYRASLDLGALRDAACRPRCGRASRRAGEAGPVGTVVPVIRVSIALEARGAEGTSRGSLYREDGAIDVGLLDPAALPAVQLVEGPDPVNGRSGVVVGRPSPFGSYRWLFPEGTHGRVTGRRGDRLRIALSDGLGAWVLAEDTRWVAPRPVEQRAFDVRVEPLVDRARIRIGLDTPVPFEVTIPDDHKLAVTFFGTVAETSRVAYGSSDALIESLNWQQRPEGLRLEIGLAQPAWGYETRWREGDARAYEGPRAASRRLGGAVLEFDVRRPPEIDAERPLRGRVIAVDPGHPGGGSYGPDGFYEGDANLAIAGHLVALLEDAGGHPILVRRDRRPLGLYDRTARALAGGAELFVSIHNNALPDGVNPLGRAGTSTYYYHPHSRELAQRIQEGMVARMGLPDLGVLWGDLAVVRTPAMPAVLTEGAFIMVPSHEAALRDPAFQLRYARGVRDGLEAFLRDRAARAAGSGSAGMER